CMSRASSFSGLHATSALASYTPLFPSTATPPSVLYTLSLHDALPIYDWYRVCQSAQQPVAESSGIPAEGVADIRAGTGIRRLLPAQPQVEYLDTAAGPQAASVAMAERSNVFAVEYRRPVGTRVVPVARLASLRSLKHQSLTFIVKISLTL